uniref:Uncharacterized protein n=1 Tax=Dendroctonus ponderosae TaxID=77166 RepID=A0AAR5Q018_DENPD
IIETGSIENTNLAQYDRLMNTNVRSVYQLTNLAVPHLIATKGNVVNVSSVNGIRAFSGVLAYCMSKAAVDQFTRTGIEEVGLLVCAEDNRAYRGIVWGAAQDRINQIDIKSHGTEKYDLEMEER